MMLILREVLKKNQSRDAAELADEPSLKNPEETENQPRTDIDILV